MKQTEGKLDNALTLLDQAEQLYYRNPLPVTRPVAALKTRVWITQNALDKALAWAKEHELSSDNELSYMREFEHLTLARLLIAQYKQHAIPSAINDAMKLLNRLLKTALEGERTKSLIEIHILKALVHESQGDITSALIELKHALKLAEPEGFVLLFVNEGEVMAGLLSKVILRGAVSGFANKVFSFFEVNDQAPQSKSYKSAVTNDQALIEPLSPRELEVLQLIAQGLSNREISERLYLALSSIKGHNQKIFNKLQVQRRTEAVSRARELELL